MRSLLLLLHGGLSNALPIGGLADAKKFDGRRLLDMSLPTAASTSSTPGDTPTVWSYFVQDAYGPGRSRLLIHNRQFMRAVDSSIPILRAVERSREIARSITSLQYLDLYEGPVVWKSGDDDWQMFEVPSSLSVSNTSYETCTDAAPSETCMIQPFTWKDTQLTPADLERVATNLKKLKYNRLVAVAKKVGVKQAVAPGVKKTGKQLAEEVSKVLNA